LKEIYELSKFNIGVVWGILNLIVGLSTLTAFKIEKHLKLRTILYLIALSVSLSYVFLGLTGSLFGAIFLIVFYYTRGIATPILKNYINNLTTSDIRATVLSVRNFVIRIIFAAAGPFFGWINDIYSIKQAFVTAGIIYLIITIIISQFIYILRKKQQNKNE
jgi:predicted MFS family arabinose efflux permease